MAKKATYQELELRIKELELTEAKSIIERDRLNNILDNTNDAICIYDLSGKVVGVNARMCQMYNISKEKALGETIENFSSSTMSMEKAHKHWERVIDGEILLFEWEALSPSDKSVFDVEVSLQKITIDDEDVIVGNIRDISDRKKAERKRRESGTKYRTLFDSSTDGIAIIDVETNRFIDCNLAAIKIFGIENRKDFLGVTPDQLSPKLQPNGELSQILANQHIQEAFKENTCEFEWIHCKSDGTTFPALITLSAMVVNKKKFIMGIMKDITNRKHKELEREKLISKLQDALENIKTLKGLLPICSTCKKIRDDKGYWNEVDTYIEEHTDVNFSHSMCTICSDKEYGNQDWYIKMKENRSNQK